MDRIVVSDQLLAQLHNLDRPLELCDAAGRVFGRFLPKLDPALYEGLEPQISPEELQRRKQNKGKTYTTAEVLAHLEKL
jgi:hypothetical protein